MFCLTTHSTHFIYGYIASDKEIKPKVSALNVKVEMLKIACTVRDMYTHFCNKTILHIMTLRISTLKY